MFAMSSRVATQCASLSNARASRSLENRRALAARAPTTTTTTRRRRGGRASRLVVRADGFSIGKLASVLAKKTQADFDRVFKGTSKTREKLSYMDEMLSLWRLEDVEETLDELEEVLISVDFGPTTAMDVIEVVRERVEKGEISTGPQVKQALKNAIVDILQRPNGGEPGCAPLALSEEAPTVIMVVGVNGAGKTTTLGKLSNRFALESGAKVMLVPGDTFRAAAAEQLATWAERSDGVMATYKEGMKPGAVCYQAVQEAIKMGDVDIVLADTSGRLHTNCDLMDELAGVRRSITKSLASAPHETLLVLDGTSGLNMLNQARAFSEAVDVTGLILTKLDGTARGGAVVSVVNEMNIPVKFVGVGEKMEDLQTFEPESFVDAIFPRDDNESRDEL
jgi:fused signal recognition particle receptor